jgi:uncharacterized protein DUF3667
MTRQLRPSPHCLNCGTAVATRFCAECGQENTSYRVSLGRLVGDLFEELFQLESRLWRTLWALVRHPGLLTREYNAGRRVRYTTPLRLYLMTSVAYFFVVAVTPPRVNDPQEVKVAFDKRELDMSKLPPPKNWFDRRVRERLGMLEKFDQKEASRRARDLIATNTPKVMAVLVPLCALLLMMFFWGHFYVEHLVMALHVHALTFLLGTMAALTRFRAVENLAMLVAFVWGYIALKRVYGQSWLRTAWKSLLLTIIYAVFVSFGVAAALIGGFFLG